MKEQANYLTFSFLFNFILSTCRFTTHAFFCCNYRTHRNRLIKHLSLKSNNEVSKQSVKNKYLKVKQFSDTHPVLYNTKSSLCTYMY